MIPSTTRRSWLGGRALLLMSTAGPLPAHPARPMPPTGVPRLAEAVERVRRYFGR